MVKAYRYRLHPDEEQLALLRRAAGSVRYVYNQGLEYRIKAYKRRGESMNYHDTRKLLNKLKKAKPWLRETYSQSLQMALRNLDSAFTNFFHNPNQFGYPNFKKKGGRNTVQYPQNCRADFQKQMLYIPKIGRVQCIFHKRFNGKIKTVTVSLEPSGDVYASVLVDDGKKHEDIPAERNVESEADVLGIDMGVKTLATCSDGTSYENGKYLSKAEKRLKREQRNLSRKKKGSSNRNKQRKKVAKINQRISNQRKDAIEKATAEIAGKSHAAVAVENLNVKGMVRNHHMAKSVSDAAMSYFLTRLETKCRNKGKTFVKIDRWYPSSQACSACGFINKEIKDLKIREWECPVCHTRHGRDANASLNIAREGYRLIARLPMDGGEVTSVEKTALQQGNQVPAVTGFAEAGRVLRREAPCL